MALKYANSADIYLNDHSWRQADFDFFTLLKGRGVQLVSVEEEGPLDYLNFVEQLKWRDTHVGIENYDQWLAWGLRDSMGLSSYAPSGEIKDIGTPRASLWGEFGRQIFQDPKLAKLANVKNRFVLVASNFWRTNSISKINFQKKLIYGLGKSQSELFEKEDMYNSVEIEAEKQSIKNVNQIITYLLKETDFDVIYRPYPTENKILMNDASILQHERFKIDRRLFSLPLILSAEAVIHTGSSIGIEAKISGTKTISLIDYGADSLSNTELTSHLVSDRPKNEDELREMCTRGLDSDDVRLKSIVTNPGSKAFYYEFVKNIQEKVITPYAVENTSISPNKRRYLYEALTKLRRGEMYRHETSKRPYLGLHRTNVLGESISKTFGFEHENLDLTPLDRDTYLIQSGN